MIGSVKIQVKPEEIIEAIKGMEKSKREGFSGGSYCCNISRISEQHRKEARLTLNVENTLCALRASGRVTQST